MTSECIEYESTASYAEIAERISQSNRIVVTTHRKPDGDAMGSVVALYRALLGIGKEVEVVLMGPVEHGLKLIVEDVPFRLVEESGLPENDADLIIVADTGAWSQLEAISDWLKTNKDKVVGLDHHANGDNVAEMRIVDVTAAACTQVVMLLCDELGVPLGKGKGSVAEAIFIGLGTDTGWFRFSNADARCFADVSRLLECGIDRYSIYRALEETAQPARLSLLERMLASIEYAGPVAIMSLRGADFRESNGSSTDIVGLVNTPLVLEHIQASILLTDSDPTVTKISFRSKPAMPDQPDSLIDVNELARKFGGGGHIHAAGARVFSPLEDVKSQLLDLIEKM